MIKNLLFISAVMMAGSSLAASINGTCGENAFWNFENGTLTISGSGATTDFENPDNLYSTKFPEWSPYIDDIEKVIVEEGITSLGDFCFYKCRNLENVSFPEGLTRIGNWTFYDCISLKNVVFPETLEVLGDPQVNYAYMGYCFYNCQSLESITIPAAVRQMGGGVFNDCTALQTVIWNAVECNSYYNDNVARFLGNFTRTGVTEVYFGPEVRIVPPYLFYDHMLLNQIHTCGSIEYVGNNAFSGTMWEGFQEREKVIYIDNAAYMYAVNSQVTDPINIVFREGTTGITDYIFSDEDRLCSVGIPVSVSRIGIHSFYNCPNLSEVAWNPVAVEFMRESPQGFNTNPLFSAALEEITFGHEVEELPDYLLSSCSGLTQVSLPPSLRKIGRNVFDGCNGLREITVPDGVESIGYEGIAWCEGLESVTIGEGLKTFGTGLFVICNNLKTIVWNAADASGEFRNGCDVAFPETLVLGDKVEAVPENFMFGKQTLSEVIFGSSVREIREAAFRGCTGLTEVDLPESLETIGKYGLMSTGISTLIIPGNTRYLDTWSLGSGSYKTIVFTPLEDFEAGSSIIDPSDELVIYVTNEELYSEWPNASLQQYIMPLVTPDRIEFDNSGDMTVEFECNIPGYGMTVTDMPELDNTIGEHEAIVEADFTGDQNFTAKFVYRYNVIGGGETDVESIFAEDDAVEVYTTGGVRIAGPMGRESVLHLDSGIYILKAGSHTEKVVVGK